MPQPSLRRKKDPSLVRIIVGICLLIALVYGGYRGYDWFVKRPGSGGAAEDASVALGIAREHLEAGRLDEARQVLEPIAGDDEAGAMGAKALQLLARVEQAAGNTEAALAHFIDAESRFPTAPATISIKVAHGNLLEEKGDLAEAKALYNDVQQTAPRALRAAATHGLGRCAEKDGDLVGARDLYKQAVSEAEWDSPEWNAALDDLGRANVALIFSPDSTPESDVYVVESGDTLTGIGNKLNTTQGMLMRANGIDDPAALRVGQRLKWTPKDFRIVIERSTCRLFVFDSQGLFKRYDTGLGMPEYETTLGVYKIGNKEKDPVWHKPGVGPIPAGDPGNELGTRWMPMVPVKEGLPTDLGIHGALDPNTVGKYSSHGCARLRMPEVEELYDYIVRSTPVTVVETVPEELHA